MKLLSEKYQTFERNIYYDAETRGTWQPVLTLLFDLDKARLIVINRYDFLYRQASLHFQTANEAQKPVYSLRWWKSAISLSKRLLRCTAIYPEKPVAFIAVACVRMKAKYYRVSRLVVLPDYQGIGVGEWLLNFIAELYSSQTKNPFYILTSNPQIIRGNLSNWKITRFGHASKGQGNTRINNEIRNSLSRNRITVTLQFIQAKHQSYSKY